jgi:hypothetical protein
MASLTIPACNSAAEPEVETEAPFSGDLYCGQALAACGMSDLRSKHSEIA